MFASRLANYAPRRSARAHVIGRNNRLLWLVMCGISTRVLRRVIDNDQETCKLLWRAMLLGRNIFAMLTFLSHPIVTIVIFRRAMAAVPSCVFETVTATPLSSFRMHIPISSSEWKLNRSRCSCVFYFHLH